MNKAVQKESWIKAPVEEVFLCFTDSKAMLRWHGKEVETDPVPGGIYKVIFENGTEINGKFLEVIPNEYVKYTAAYGNVPSTVEIRFTAENGGTRIEIRQEFGADQDISSFEQGWGYFLELLEKNITS